MFDEQGNWHPNDEKKFSLNEIKAFIEIYSALSQSKGGQDQGSIDPRRIVIDVESKPAEEAINLDKETVSDTQKNDAYKIRKSKVKPLEIEHDSLLVDRHKKKKKGFFARIIASFWDSFLFFWYPFWHKNKSWMISAAFHLVVVIILGILVFPSAKAQYIELILLPSGEEELIGGAFDLSYEDLPIDEPLTVDDSLQDMITEGPDLDLDFDLTDIIDSSQIFEPEVLVDTDEFKSTEQGEANSASSPFEGRSGELKAQLLKAGGGDQETEGAVENALRWLDSKQHKNRRDLTLLGSWNLLDNITRDNAKFNNRVAATALAMLAFQGAGHTHKSGDYKQALMFAKNWLVKNQQKDGSWKFKGEENQHFYSHAIATMALCELYAITKDYRLKVPARNAVEFCVASQSPLGGWRYRFGDDSDTSVTGWFVMALKSGQMAGFDVPDETFNKITDYLNKASHRGWTEYSYQIGGPSTPTMTAEALLCRQYLGWKKDNPRISRGINYFTKEDVSINNQNVYFWYYATQVMRHQGGEGWDQWNKRMKKILTSTQLKEGANNGSWDNLEDYWGERYGRLYVTCLSVYTLEVYYRHLPLYQDIKINVKTESSKTPKNE